MERARAARYRARAARLTSSPLPTLSPRGFRRYVAFLQVARLTAGLWSPGSAPGSRSGASPPHPQAGLKALQGDGDAQAIYLDVYRQVTASEASLAEVLKRLIAEHHSRKTYYMDRDVAALTELVAPSAGSPRRGGRDWTDAFLRKRWRASKTRGLYDPLVLKFPSAASGLRP
jgi:hypothetical protein